MYQVRLLPSQTSGWVAAPVTPAPVTVNLIIPT